MIHYNKVETKKKLEKAFGDYWEEHGEKDTGGSLGVAPKKKSNGVVNEAYHEVVEHDTWNEHLPD